MPMKNIYVITGSKHRGPAMEGLLRGSHSGTIVELERDPGNEYDRKAVKVLIDDQHVGFLAARENKDVAAWIDAKCANKKMLGRLVFVGQQPHVEVTFP